MNDGYKIIEENGYRHFDPIPSNEELDEFYKNKYFNLIKEGTRAPEIRRLMSDEKDQEHNWLCNTLYADVAHILINHSCKNILEIGCGTGDFLQYMKDYGFNVTGIEPSHDAYDKSISKGLNVFCMFMDEFIDKGIGNFDSVILLSVLEHVPDPIQFINQVKRLLSPGGIICIRVPNDFNALQLKASEKIRGKEWWISAPDHINYFNIDSLKNILADLNFNIVYTQTDFPMELFLLMGDDYVTHPELGSECHKKRVNLELSMDPELRRRMYQALSNIGIGRTVLIFGELRK